MEMVVSRTDMTTFIPKSPQNNFASKKQASFGNVYSHFNTAT